MDISITLLIISIFFGFFLGIISGLTPGIHVNNFALILLALTPLFLEMGFAPFYIAVIILSNSVTQTFVDIIPSIFLGAPEADTALAVLPGHQLLMEGRGAEAVRLSAIGSAGSVATSLLIAVPLGFFFMNIYGTIDAYIGWILVLIAVLMIATENGEVVEGQGSLAHLKYKGYAVILFFLSGMLGLFAFENTDKMAPLITFGEPSILLPLLSGLFGASMLVLALMTRSEVPPQQKNSMFALPGKRIVRGIISGTAAGSFVAWLPGVSSAVGTIIARLLVREDKGEEASKEFIIALSGANTANAIFSLIALYTIHRTRSGAMVAINELTNVDEWDMSVIILLLAVIVYVSIISYYTTIYLGDRISGMLSKIDYSKLCSAVLIILTLMVIMFTGWFGLVIFLISTIVGMVSSFAKIRKTHAMGVILLPVILYFF
ncbi:MAG: tripartite tricarboxylate transporter permease [Euryarchaeota archaeon]|nr:tripartite tricarboxylate transporter permease [Euryarchaeota archaeon]MBU4223444.1 tripartite tricarboxylate transporter permease [Euryarchaeota archaeon]MCG2734830.1 tripartite tricarboxylate transporter permease [Candidatus Methanoperedenaceae archaeon]